MLGKKTSKTILYFKIYIQILMRTLWNMVLFTGKQIKGHIFWFPIMVPVKVFKKKKKRISGYKTETNPSILIKMTPKNLRRQRKKKWSPTPSSFCYNKSSQSQFSYVSSAKERENNIFAWNDFSLFIVNQNTQSKGVYTG